MSTKAIIKADGFILHSGYDGFLLGIGKYIANALSNGKDSLELINLLLKDIEYTKLITNPEIWECQYLYNISYILRDKPEEDVEIWTYYIEVKSNPGKPIESLVFEGWLIDFVTMINKLVEWQNKMIRDKKANNEFCLHEEQDLVEPTKTEHYKYVGKVQSKAILGCENV